MQHADKNAGEGIVVSCWADLVAHHGKDSARAIEERKSRHEHRPSAFFKNITKPWARLADVGLVTRQRPPCKTPSYQ